MTNTKLIAQLEQAGFRSWPAEREWRDVGLVARLSPHLPYQRCSSINFAADCAAVSDDALARIRPEFTAAGKPLVFRITPLAPDGFDAELAEQGWRAHDETLVMTAGLAGIPASADVEGQTEVADDPSEAWIAAYARFARAMDHTGTFRDVLSRIEPDAFYFARRSGEDIVAVGVMVQDGPMAGLFGLCTDDAHRRQGHAEAISRHALAIARKRGATLGWLQVVAKNASAIALYEKMGFETAYRYHYRLPPEPS